MHAAKQVRLRQHFPGYCAGFTFWLKNHRKGTPFLPSSPAIYNGSSFPRFIDSKAIHIPLLPFTSYLDSAFPSKGDKNPANSHLSPSTSLGHPNRLTQLPLAGLPASPHPLPVSGSDDITPNSNCISAHEPQGRVKAPRLTTYTHTMSPWF